MLSDKARKHLKLKLNKNRRVDIEEKILEWLSDDNCRDSVFKISDLMMALMIGKSTIYSSIYQLAIDNKIGFASRNYHIFYLSQNETIKKTKPSRVGTLLWHKDHLVSVPLREEWLDVPISTQLTLFDDGLDKMTNEQLTDLIEKAERLQIKRGIDKRYECLYAGIREQLVDIFAKIKITDPVYFAHSDESISLLTYTAVPSMPIDIVLDTGDGPKRMNCKHLTIFGKSIVNATDSMFGGE